MVIYGINPVSVALSTEMLKALYYEPNSQSERVQQLHAQAAAATAGSAVMARVSTTAAQT